MTSPLLDIRHVVKSFGGLKAVNDVSFSVARDEILGIAGPNGSGKSTLFNVITGIPFGPTSGEVHFTGDRIDRWPPHRIARAGLSRTFQRDAEFPDLNALETAVISSVYCGRLDSRQARERAAEALDRVGFEPDRRTMPTADLSVFERKLLMIASALAARPSVLMLDEPASGLTRLEVEQLDALLLSINGSGVTIVLIEHVLSLLLSVSERLIVLNQGAVIAEGDPKEVVKSQTVIDAYLGGQS